MTDERYDASDDQSKFIAAVDGIVNGSNPTLVGLSQRTGISFNALEGFLWRNYDFFYIDPQTHVHLQEGAVDRADEYRLVGFDATDEEVLLAVKSLLDDQYKHSLTLTRLASLILIPVSILSDILNRNSGLFERIISPDDDGNRFSRIEGPTADGVKFLAEAASRGVVACRLSTLAHVAGISLKR